jgi:hypothetical protein
VYMRDACSETPILIGLGNRPLELRNERFVEHLILWDKV